MIKNYANEQAQIVKTADCAEKKTNLSHTEKIALWGYFYEIYTANRDDWGLAIDYADIYSESMIQNDEIYVLMGDGIRLDDSHRFNGIFFNKYGVVCMSVIDDDTETEQIYI